MRRSLLLVALAWAACVVLAGAQDARKPEPGYAKVEIRGVLKAAGEYRKMDFAALQYAPIAAPGTPLTGVTVQTARMGPIDVLLPDQETHDLARKLNGQTVVLTGELHVVSDLSTIYQRMWSQWEPQPPSAPAIRLVVQTTSLKAAKAR